MTNLQLHEKNYERDAALSKAVHGDSHKKGGGLWSMFGKSDANDAVTKDYFKHFHGVTSNETEEHRISRKRDYANLTRNYYDISTDLYEYGWGQCFHFSRFAPGESFYQSIARHEHYLASLMGLRSGMKVLDVGCGVGGPAREMVKFADVNVTGLNNNDYQIQRARRYAVEEGLEHKMDFVKGDFMQMDFESNTFDAVYAIEATVHAQTLVGVYSEIFRVLKPGGVFGLYEWVMTDKYNPKDPNHVKVRQAIELGNGISNMDTVAGCLRAMKEAGFEVDVHEDLANKGDKIPWYWPIAGEMKHLASYTDLFTVLRMTKACRSLMHSVFGLFETFGLFPKGVKQAADGLAIGADGLVAGAKLGLFTPMYLVIARKPLQ